MRGQQPASAPRRNDEDNRRISIFHLMILSGGGRLAMSSMLDEVICGGWDCLGNLVGLNRKAILM